jgi:putative peptide zinc metalloprotease protein
MPVPPPRLAAGTELLGRFEDSGFQEPPYLARRGDGQVIQLTWLLHLVAEACDGERDEAAIAELVSERFGRGVSGDNVRALVDKLRPLGVLAQPDGSTPPMRKMDPLLALRHRTVVVSEPATNRIAQVLRPLHTAPVLVLALLAIAAFDVWLFAAHGVAGGLRAALYDPLLLLGLMAAIVAATAWHEFGHASACRHGGARPGAMGAGVYLVWPAFYCDVTDAYRLDRRGRLRTDLGGVYFNGLFALAAAGAYALTRFEPLLLLVVAQHVIALQQLLPMLRFDGYYVLSDATGVPDILGRVPAILRSLWPGREPEPAVTELKPRVRRVVTAYVALIVPLLLFMLTMALVSAPRIFATAWDSIGQQADKFGDGGPAGAALGAVQIVTLALPCLALCVTAVRIGRRAAGAGHPAVRIVVATALAGLLAWQWWPNGDYRPIGKDEKGTLSDAVRSVSAIPSGRPATPPPAEPGREPAATPGPAATATPEPEQQQQEREEEATPTPTPEATEEPAEEEAPAPTPTPTPSPEPTPEEQQPAQESTPTPTPTTQP